VHREIRDIGNEILLGRTLELKPKMGNKKLVWMMEMPVKGDDARDAELLESTLSSCHSTS